MPIFPYRCAGCGLLREELVRDIAEPVVCAACALAMKRGLGVPVTRVALWLRDEAYEGRARNREYLDRPEIRAKIRSGELECTGRSDDF